MKEVVALFLSLGLLACTPMPPDDSPKPNPTEGSSYHVVNSAALLYCNTWGFETRCRTSPALPSAK